MAAQRRDEKDEAEDDITEVEMKRSLALRATIKIKLTTFAQVWHFHPVLVSLLACAAALAVATRAIENANIYH